MTGETDEDRAGETDEDGADDPQAMLATLQSQSTVARQQFRVDTRLLYAVWGVAWLLGFIAQFLSTPHGHTPTITPAAGGLTFGALMVVAAAVTMAHLTRKGRGVRGRSSQQSAMYGAGWFAGFVALFAIGSGLERTGASDAVLAEYFTNGSGLVVGLMYLAGGNLWQDRMMYTVGVWLLAVFAISAVVGLPFGYLVIAALGGGGFIATGLLVPWARSAGWTR